ncbi:MAG: glycosyltransferase family 4 protein [Herpetosiphonaceae bacterium]|nr:glycosyltransferase family 4 protein [Herpetosiphonaceae bacterium]
MRVAMIAPFGIRPKGTLGQRALPLAQELHKQGIAVRIVAPAYLNPEDADTRQVVDGVEVVHVRLPRLPGAAAFAETAWTLWREAKRWRPDVLHVFKPKGYSGLAALLAHLDEPGLPIIQDTDDWEGWGGWNELLPYPQWMKYVFAWQERSLARQARCVTVASRRLQTQAWGFGIVPERVHYLPNGVGTPPALPDRCAARRALHLDDAPVVLLYTRFWEYPLRMIIECLVGLRSQCPQARLLVMGAGERNEAEVLQQWADRVGVAEQLDVRGWAELPMLHQAWAAADVAIVPFADSLMNRAKCSVKLLELLNAGVPVVASAVGQANEYIESERTGVLVRPDDGGVLAGATVRLLRDETLRERLGRSGQAFVQSRFGWQGLAAQLASVYEQVLAQGQP